MTTMSPILNGRSNGVSPSFIIIFGEMLIDFIPMVSGVSLAEAPGYVKAPAALRPTSPSQSPASVATLPSWRSTPANASSARRLPTSPHATLIRGSAGIKIDDGVTIYSVEELVAMILSYGTNLAEHHARVSIKDCVITVPPYFGQGLMQALMQAAHLAGINVLGLINEHAGAALQYGIDKDFLNESKHVIFYDMGSSSTYAKK